MKIFKNRGDIFFSKSDMKADFEQRILKTVLIFVVIFTLLFVSIFAIRYDFSIKKFFEPENMKENISSSIDEELPEVSGKNNFLVLITDDDNESLYYSTLIQVDMDSISYKVCNFIPSTVLDGTSLERIYADGGINNVVSALQETISIDIDYYVVMASSDMESFIDDMGKINYPMAEDIRFKDNESKEAYSIRLKAGEHSLDGRNFTKLMRYYNVSQSDVRSSNELVLDALSDLITVENSQKSEDIFKNFIKVATTNITVKDFSSSNDMFSVLTSETVGVNAYSINIDYKKADISSTSISEIKSYFAK